jgi:hypothetical protein
MGMIEFEDHSEENQRALLAYLDRLPPINVAPTSPQSRGARLLTRLYRQIRLTLISVFHARS